MLVRFVRTVVARFSPSHTPEQVRDLISKGRLTEAAEAAGNLPAQTLQQQIERRCLQAEIAFRRGDDIAAEEGFRAVLAQEPGNPDAHYGLSLLLYEAGDAEAALRHAQFATSARPIEYRYIAQLGLCHVRLGNFPIAERLMRKALHGLPEDKSCWNNMGIVYAAKGNPAQARQCFERALALDPSFENAKKNLALLGEDAPAGSEGRAPVTSDARAAVEGQPVWQADWLHVTDLQQEGDADGALELAERLLDSWPEDAALASRVAQLYGQAGDLQGGIDTMEAFVARRPDEPAGWVSLARAYAATSSYLKAEAAVRRALSLGDDASDTHLLLGEILHFREEFDQAADCCERALEKAASPSDALLAQLGASQVMACRYESALATYERLFAGRPPHHHPSVGGYAMCLTYMGRFAEAREILDTLLHYSPHDPGLRAQSFQLRLLHGDLAAGWEDYLYRGLSAGKSFRVLPFPRWQGEPLHGKRIVVLAEQGLGDQVMLASCLPDLAALGPEKVYVEAMHRVAPTLARSFPAFTVIATNQDRDLDWVKEVGQADYYVPLGDLPYHFRRSWSDFPRQPFLEADPDRVEFWKQQLRSRGPGPYVGVSWRGGTQVTRAPVRSFQAERLAAIGQGRLATWVNLQYGQVQDELRAAEAAGMRIHHWSEAIENLDEFAALISALDAVVTVCNTTVHYAGGLGKHVAVLAPNVPEWRYGLSSEDMPWYPHVYVLRQPSAGDWEPVLTKAGSLLDKWLCSSTRIVTNPLQEEGLSPGMQFARSR